MRIYNTRFFPRAEIVRLAADMVDNLFSHPMTAVGKTVWYEKTPHNLLRLEKLAELFPDALFCAHQA